MENSNNIKIGSFVISKETLKSLQAFNEHQRPGPSFVIIYILTWLVWHNQLFTSFFATHGDILDKASAAFTSIEDNQYIVVLFLTCIIFSIRLVINFIRFKSSELLNSVDEDFTVGGDKNFAKSSDMANLMATFEKNKQKLIDANEREKVAIAEKHAAIKKLMVTQHELEEAKAEIAILTKSLNP